MNGLVIGGAACVWQDVAALEEVIGREWDGITLAVNDAAWAWPRRLDHFVTLHPERLPEWRAKREANGYPGGYITWGGVWRTGVDDGPLVDRVLPVTEVGSSGLHAALVALEVGCERVVLAGTPMDAQKHFSRGENWDMAWWHRKGWEQALPKLQGRVRSMSGWTQELLGAVTLEWLQEAR